MDQRCSKYMRLWDLANVRLYRMAGLFMVSHGFHYTQCPDKMTEELIQELICSANGQIIPLKALVVKSVQNKVFLQEIGRPGSFSYRSAILETRCLIWAQEAKWSIFHHSSRKSLCLNIGAFTWQKCIVWGHNFKKWFKYRTAPVSKSPASGLEFLVSAFFPFGPISPTFPGPKLPSASKFTYFIKKP